MKLFSQYRGLRKELYVLCIGRMMTNLGSMIWPIFTLILSDKLGMDAAKIALFTLMYTIVAIPMTLLAGKLADSFNKKNLIIIFDLISVGAYIYAAFAPLSVLTIIIFMAASLFQTIEYSSYDALVADFTSSKDRERAFSLTYLCANLGLVLSPTIGGLLFNNYLWLSFLISGFSIAFSTLLIFIFVKDIKKESNDMDDEYEQNLDEKTNIFKFIFTNGVLILFIIYGGIESGFYSMYNYLLPLDLSATFGENGSIIFGTLSSLNCIVVVTFTALLTSLLKKFYDTTKVIFGMALFIVGYFIFFSLIDIAAFSYVGMIIFTWGEILVTVNMSPFLTRRIPASHRGRLMAFSNIFGSVAGSLIELGVGEVYDNYGRGPSWLVAIGLGVLALIVLVLLRYFDKKKYTNLYHSKTSKDGCLISVRSATIALLKEYARSYKYNENMNSDLFYNNLHYNSDSIEQIFNNMSNDSSHIYFFLMSDATPIGQIILSKKENNECEYICYLSNKKFLDLGYEDGALDITTRYASKRFNLRIIDNKNISL